ncbi:hypothetical protein BGZ47_004359 [Haplosporangium gracile]|nr:hypothetical protein BGZ47_004359 [Haplosporangium gracile]
MVATTAKATTRNPFDLPELRHRVSRYVSIKVAISCFFVSQAWKNDSFPVVWHQVDFESQFRLADLAPDIISKYGHVIRIVKNVKAHAQVTVLANSSVHHLMKLRVEITAEYLCSRDNFQELTIRSKPCISSYQ